MVFIKHCSCTKVSIQHHLNCWFISYRTTFHQQLIWHNTTPYLLICRFIWTQLGVIHLELTWCQSIVLELTWSHSSTWSFSQPTPLPLTKWRQTIFNKNTTISTLVVLFCQICCLFVCHRLYYLNSTSNSPSSIYHPKSATFNGQSHQQHVTLAMWPLSTQQCLSKCSTPSHNKYFPCSRFNKQVLQVYCAPRHSLK